MTATELGPHSRRALSRFPDFTRGGNSLLHAVVAAVAGPLDDLAISLQQVLESHWVERANGGDLNRMGALFAVARRTGETDDEYRLRLMRHVANFLRHGCTPRGIFEAVAAALSVELRRDGEAAIITQLDEYRLQVLTGDGLPIILEETPLHTRAETVHDARSGRRWVVSHWGADVIRPQPTVPTIVLYVGQEPVTGPLVVNLTTGEGVGFEGQLSAGAKLTFHPDGSVLLNDEPAFGAYRFRGALFDDAAWFGGSTFIDKVPDGPYLPVGESKWAFFDAFDRSLGGLPSNPYNDGPSAHRPLVAVSLSWVERQRAAFVVRLPGQLSAANPDEVLDRARVAVSRVRAAGVKATVEYQIESSETRGRGER